MKILRLKIIKCGSQTPQFDIGGFRIYYIYGCKIVTLIVGNTLSLTALYIFGVRCAYDAFYMYGLYTYCEIEEMVAGILNTNIRFVVLRIPEVFKYHVIID